jgi:deoxycytidine triphosphate deaminase
MLTDYEKKYRAKYLEHDSLVEEIIGATSSFNLHVAPNSFRVWRSADEQISILKKYGYPPFNDPINTPLEIREMLLEDIQADPQNNFVFEPDRLYLAFTSESVTIPGDQLWRMRSFFTVDDCFMLSLTTNLDAPLLKPHSRGPQTYEIRNFGRTPLVVPINRLTCSTVIIPIHSIDVPSDGTFSIQSGQRPTLGKI